MNASTKPVKANKTTSFVYKPSKISRDSETKKNSWVAEYIDHFGGKIQPVPESFLHQLAEELLHYAETTEILRIEWFFTQKRMRPQSARDWAASNQVFGEAYKTAHLILGMRREHGALNKVLSETMVIKRQHAYDPEWAADKEKEKQDKIDIAIQVAKANAEGMSKPATIILGQLPGLEEYQKTATQIDKDLIE